MDNIDNFDYKTIAIIYAKLVSDICKCIETCYYQIIKEV